MKRPSDLDKMAAAKDSEIWRYSDSNIRRTAITFARYALFLEAENKTLDANARPSLAESNKQERG